jgi:hypothetical protein
MTERSVVAGALPAAECTGTTSSSPTATFERVLTYAAVASCAVLIVYKLVLVRLLNVNWDEFYFLSLVYELSRGELKAVMQGAFTHLFAWLPMIAGDEIDQIVVARVVMVGLLAMTAWLIWRVGLVWLQGFTALVPPFVYLSMMSVLQHGGSFRYDSMLAPLSMAALLLLLAPGYGPRRDWLAGCLLGVGGAASVKVVLFAPIVLLVLLLRQTPSANARLAQWRDGAQASVRIAVAATSVLIVLIGLHWAAIAPVAADSVTNFAASSARKTLLEPPWFPQYGYFARYVDWQPYSWLMIGLGTVLAVLRRRFVLAALSLSLLPLLFYRNAFPYYYVVMLAPASVLAGYAVAAIWDLVRVRVSALVAGSLLSALWIGFLIQAVQFASPLAFDDQVLQRQVIAGVHQIFPTPVSYIDRSGMVPSFRKVNFFMSTWGVETYRAVGKPFMPEALSRHRPAFVLANTPFLSSENTGRYGLLSEDRELLAKYYVDYWGPVRVAGAHASIGSTNQSTVTVPFAADYRLQTTGAVFVNGALRVDGDVIAVPAEGVTISSAAGSGAEPISVTLVLASARPPPREYPAGFRLFRNL